MWPSVESDNKKRARGGAMPNAFEATPRASPAEAAFAGTQYLCDRTERLAGQPPEHQSHNN